jgi:hypothetical protein
MEGWLASTDVGVLPRSAAEVPHSGRAAWLTLRMRPESDLQRQISVMTDRESDAQRTLKGLLVSVAGSRRCRRAW